MKGRRIFQYLLALAVRPQIAAEGQSTHCLLDTAVQGNDTSLYLLASVTEVLELDDSNIQTFHHWDTLQSAQSDDSQPAQQRALYPAQTATRAEVHRPCLRTRRMRLHSDVRPEFDPSRPNP